MFLRELRGSTSWHKNCERKKTTKVNQLNSAVRYCAEAINNAATFYASCDCEDSGLTDDILDFFAGNFSFSGLFTAFGIFGGAGAAFAARASKLVGKLPTFQKAVAAGVISNIAKEAVNNSHEFVSIVQSILPFI